MTKKCELCDNIIPSTIVIDGKRRVLTNRKYCLECSPFGNHNTKAFTKSDDGQIISIGKRCNHIKSNDKKCKECNTTKFGDFYEKHHNLCKKCCSQNTINKGRLMKQRAVDYKGGCCELCGYNKCIASLEFHHVDPSEKDSDARNFRYWKWERVVTEIDKCILVCANCHREIHDELWNAKIPKKTWRKFT